MQKILHSLILPDLSLTVTWLRRKLMLKCAHVFVSLCMCVSVCVLCMYAYKKLQFESWMHICSKLHDDLAQKQRLVQQQKPQKIGRIIKTIYILRKIKSISIAQRKPRSFAKMFCTQRDSIIVLWCRKNVWNLTVVLCALHTPKLLSWTFKMDFQVFVHHSMNKNASYPSLCFFWLQM